MLIILNLSNGEWNVIKEDEQTISDINIKFGFTDDNPPVVVFDNLSFGFKYKSNDMVIHDVSYPDINIKYISTDQQYIESYNVSIDFETKVYLTFWAINAGNYYEFTYEPDVIPAPILYNTDFDQEIEEIFNNAG